MRNPMFRIWDKVNKEWLHKDFHLIGEVMLLEGLPIERLNDLEVNQYTGLEDKNGKYIYEGDIVKATASKTFENKILVSDVIFSLDNGWVVRERDDSSRIYEHGLSISWGGWEEIEVIGNIYEDLELL